MSRDDSETKGGGSRLVSWVKSVPLVAATDPRIEALIFSYRTDVILPRSMRKESLQPALAFFSLSDLQKRSYYVCVFRVLAIFFNASNIFNIAHMTSSLRRVGMTDRPSMCGGAGTPAISRNVGARSMLRTG